MRAGEMTYSLAFEKRSDSSADSPSGDGYGNFENGWASQFECAAKILPLRGGENVLAGRLEGTESVIISVHTSQEARSVETGWRARDLRSGDIYNIRSIPPHERKSVVEMLAESGVAT